MFFSPSHLTEVHTDNIEINTIGAVLVVPDGGNAGSLACVGRGGKSSKMYQSSFIWTGVRVCALWSLPSIHCLISAFCSAVLMVGP